MSSISNIAASALVSYGVSQAVTANNVANANTPNFKASSTVLHENRAGGVSATVSQGSETVEISREAVAMNVTSNGFKASLKLLQAEDEMSREVLNIKA